MSTNLVESNAHSVTTQADSAAIIQVIERAAMNPDVDIDKMERLLQMQERIMARNAETAFNAAMTDAQGDMRQVATDANNPQTRSKYATYSALDKALRPVYTRYGFSLSFDTGEGVIGEFVRVICHVSHRDGHSRTYHVDMPADGMGAKGGAVMTKTHAAGAAMSYGMRYLLKMIFNVAIGEDDTDGNMPVERITHGQVADLEALITEVGADEQAFCRFMMVKHLGEIPANQYKRAVAALEAKRKAAK